MEQIEKLQAEVEETKKEIHTTLGKKLIESLDLDYELLSSKKDISFAVDKIVNNLPNHLFTDSNNNYIHEEEYSELNSQLQNS